MDLGESSEQHSQWSNRPGVPNKRLTGTNRLVRPPNSLPLKDTSIEWEPMLSLKDSVGDLFGSEDLGDLGEQEKSSVDFAAIEAELLVEYQAFINKKILRLAARKAISIYEYTAPNIPIEVAHALCRLSLEWWIIDSALDYECHVSVPTEVCRQLLLANAMMFWDDDYIALNERALHPLQRGFCATAKLCWQRGPEFKVWTQFIASELNRYIFSGNIGVKNRIDTFECIEDALRARSGDSGMVAQLLLTELSAGPFRLSDEVRRSAVYVNALRHLSTMSALINDIASTYGDFYIRSLNIALFLYNQRSPDELFSRRMHAALQSTCVLLRKEHEQFVISLDELEHQGSASSEAVSQYVAYLKSFLQRYWCWHLACDSYFNPNHPVVEFRRYRTHRPA